MAVDKSILLSYLSDLNNPSQGRDVDDLINAFNTQWLTGIKRQDGDTLYLDITRKNGTVVSIDITSKTVVKDGLISPIGVVEFDESINRATVTLPFQVAVDGEPRQTPEAPNNTIDLVEKDATFNRWDTIVYDISDDVYEAIIGDANGSPTVPLTPAGKIKLAEIFRPVTGPSIITVADLTDYLPTSGGNMSGPIIMERGTDIRFRGSFAIPNDPGDVIGETYTGVEIWRIFGFGGEKFLRVRFTSTDVERILQTNKDFLVEEINIVGETDGVVEIDFTQVATNDVDERTRLAYFGQYPTVLMYELVGGIKTYYPIGYNYNTTTNILTIEGVFGNKTIVIKR